MSLVNTFQTFQTKSLSTKLVSILAFTTIVAALHGCGGGGGGGGDSPGAVVSPSDGGNVDTPSGGGTANNGDTPSGSDNQTPTPLPSTTPPATTFNVKNADFLYTTAQPISVAQLQTGLAINNHALPVFVLGKYASARNGLMAGLQTNNSSTFNLVTIGSDGVSRPTLQSTYFYRVLYTASPPNFDSINGRALTDPNVYIAFTADPYPGDTADYSQFITKNAETPCALYHVNTNTNAPECTLPNVEPVAYFDENRNWGLFDGGNRKPIQFDAQGNIYVSGYPFTVNNGKVVKSTSARLYKIQANTYTATPLTQDNESVAFFALFPSGEAVAAMKRNTGTDLVLFRDTGNGIKRYSIATGVSEPFVNTDTYRTLIYGSASGTKGINLVRTSATTEGVERATLDYNTQTGTNYNLQAGGKTYSGLIPRRIISGDDGKFYTVYSASDSEQNNALLVYQTLPFAKNAVAVIPVTGEWWTWMKSRPIQIKRGILYYADVQDRANAGPVDIIKVIRLLDGTPQVLFANKSYRIDSWQAQGDTLYFSGIDNEVNQVVQGQINTKRIAQQSDWSANAWQAFSPVNITSTASATAASLNIQDMENLRPQQPKVDTGMTPGILHFDSTDKAASLSFTKYMDMREVESKLQITPKTGGTAPAVFPLWAYQNLHLVFDTSNGLSNNVTTGLPAGGGRFDLQSTDNLPDAYGWSIPQNFIIYTVAEKQNETGIYALPDITGLTINTQPGSQTVIAGRTATFSVSVVGTQPITYQWKKNGSNIPGATQSSYTTPATSAQDDDSSFAVEVTNPSGTKNSSTVKLGVISPPTLLTQPTAQTVAIGQTASFSVIASGSAVLRYQWKKNGANISGATSRSYTTPAASNADNGAIYTVQISNDAGSATSSNATLTVNALSESVRNAQSHSITQKYFGASGDESGLKILKMADGNLLSVGKYTNGSFAMKTSTSGEQIWIQTFGTNQTFQDVIATSDGNYLGVGTCGNCGNGRVEGFITKFDTSGNELWTKNTFDGTDVVIFFKVQQTSDGGYIIAGNTTNTDPWLDFLLMKVSSVGNVEWVKYFGRSYDDTAWEVKQTADGGYILAGFSGGWSSNPRAWVVKTNSSGNTVWDKTFGTASCGNSCGWDKITGIELVDQGYLLFGNRYVNESRKQDAMIVKIDTNGNQLWEKVYASSGDENIKNYKKLPNGGYVLTGSQITSSSKTDGYILVVDSQFNVIDSITLGGNDDDSFDGVFALSNTQYVLTGSNKSAGNGGTDIWFVNVSSAAATPASGITASQCYQAGSDSLVSCSSSGAQALNALQDGDRANINAMSYGFVADANGVNYDKIECVKDNITGLIWEGKTANGTRAGSNTYTNYDSNYFGTQAQTNAANNSLTYVAAVNASLLCGYSDWRLPTVEELQTLVDYGIASPGPTIKTDWFPNTPGNVYWSSTSVYGDASRAWNIYFNNGDVNFDVDTTYRARSNAIRLVRTNN